MKYLFEFAILQQIYFVLFLSLLTLVNEGAGSKNFAMSGRLAAVVCRNYWSKTMGEVMGNPNVQLGGSCHYFDSACGKEITGPCKFPTRWKMLPCSDKTSGPPGSAAGGGSKGTTTGNNNKAGGGSRPSGGAGVVGGSNKRNKGQSSRIVGGVEAIPNIHPYVVVFEYRTNRTTTGGGGGLGPIRVEFHGTLYNAYTILVHSDYLKRALREVDYKYDRLFIRAGKHVIGVRENSEQLRFMCDFSHHPKECNGTFSYSLVHLYDPFTFNKLVGKINLGRQNQSDVMGTSCKFPGWGATESNEESRADVLQEIDIETGNTTCTGPVSEYEICGNGSFCYGDAGSPLICTAEHRIYASALGARTLAEKTGSCAESSVFNDVKRDDIHEWIKERHKEIGEKCRPNIRINLAVSSM